MKKTFFYIAGVLFTVLLLTSCPGRIRLSEVTIELLHSLQNVDSFTLSVTAPDIEEITAEGSGTVSSMTVPVEIGPERLFTVVANIKASDPGTVLSYKGFAAEDIDTKEPVTIEIDIDRINKTKILIPDHGYYNYGNNRRVVQIDDIEGENWEEITHSDFYSNESHFAPWDVDLDGQGRIYIANRSAASGEGRVIRVDNIRGDNIFLDLPGSDRGIICLTIDRVDDTLYFADGNSPAKLFACNLDGTEHRTLDTAGIDTIRGLAIDEDQNLFIAGEDQGSGDVLFRYNPSTESIEKTYGSGDSRIHTAWDVLVKDDHVYLANYKGENGFLIMQFDKNLTFIEGFGNESDDLVNPEEKEFFGPHRFVAIINKKITIIDENEKNEDEERIVSFGDMEGNDWESFTPDMVGESAFGFFELY